MLDSARHYQSPATIKRLIDQLARYKLNRLHWHFVDNQAWRPEIDAYPRLTEPYGRAVYHPSYSKADIRDVIAYARDRYITVYPEVEQPGHSRAAVARYPDLLKCDIDGPPGKEMCLGNPGSRQFLRAVIDELADLFPAPYLHIGGDEANTEHWTACPVCQSQLSELELTDPRSLQKWFVGEVSGMVHAAGKTPVAWAEDLEGEAAASQIVQAWRPGEALEAIRRGCRVVNSNKLYLYFDYPNADGDVSPWKMHDIPVRQVYRFDPVPAEATDAEANLILGSEACLWTEAVPESWLDVKVFPRLLAFSEVVWSPAEDRQWENFAVRAGAELDRLRRAGIRAWPSNDVLVSAETATPAADPNPRRFMDAIRQFSEVDRQSDRRLGGLLLIGGTVVSEWRGFDDTSPIDGAIINRGVRGAHLSDVAYFLDETTFPHQPEAILISAGEEDIASGKSSPRVVDDFSRIVALIRQRTQTTPILFASIIPQVANPEDWPAIHEANERIRMLCDTQPDLHFIDVSNALLRADRHPDPSLYEVDGRSLNEAGYQIWGATLAQALRQHETAKWSGRSLNE